MSERHCHDCRWCGMDMDLDPFCTHAKVAEAGWPYGLVLHSTTLRRICPSPEKPLFEARAEKKKKKEAVR